MKKLAVVLCLLSWPAIAQEKKETILPVTLDPATYSAMMAFLQDVPMRYAAPIAGKLQELQVRAQMDAAAKAREEKK